MPDLPPENPDALLTREQTAAALTVVGFPISAKTLATRATRGGGPPYRHFGPRVIYRWGDSLAWAHSLLGELRLSTSETDVGAKPPSQNATIVDDFSGADVGSGGGVNTGDRAGSASAPLPSPTPLALATRHRTRGKR
jgi:hypothetical protein